MSATAPTYDLVMLLDPQAEDDARQRPLADARAAIESEGELLRHDDWGDRALTYPIDHRSSAEYHLLQFHVGSPELLRTLDRSLRIADEVLRFRIIKLKPGVPEPPDMRTTAPPARRTGSEPASRPAEQSEPAADAAGPAADAPAVPAGQAEPPVTPDDAPEPAPEAGVPSESRPEETS
jgi:small subunit ribosomal protein S6